MASSRLPDREGTRKSAAFPWASGAFACLNCPNLGTDGKAWAKAASCDDPGLDSVIPCDMGATPDRTGRAIGRTIAP